MPILDMHQCFHNQFATEIHQYTKNYRSWQFYFLQLGCCSTSDSSLSDRSPIILGSSELLDETKVVGGWELGMASKRNDISQLELSQEIMFVRNSFLLRYF